MFDYFYETETEQYLFYRIPQILFTSPLFRKISSDAKVLYGIFLDRTGLSIKNNWIDSNGRVFIYYKVDEIADVLGCHTQKARKVLAELDSEKGIGLISRKRQGQGKPDRIYVRNFNSPVNQKSDASGSSDIKKSESHSSGKKSPDKRSESHSSGKSKITSPEKCSSPFPTISNTEREITSDSDSFNHSVKERNRTSKNRNDKNDSDMNEYREMENLIKTNICYDWFAEGYKSNDLSTPGSLDQLNELVDIMLDCTVSTADTIRVGKSDIPAEVVKSRMLKIDSSHIEYIFHSLSNNSTKIKNIRNYLITTLYNAPSTMSNHISTQVSHDLYGSSG